MNPHRASGTLTGVYKTSHKFPSLPPDDGAIKSRLCEQIWLDADLFEDDPVVLFFDEFYPILSDLTERDLTGGSLGEHLLVHGIDPEAVVVGQIIQIGDAKFQTATAPNPPRDDTGELWELPVAQMLQTLPWATLTIIEEGLAEPGAPVIIR